MASTAKVRVLRPCLIHGETVLPGAIVDVPLLEAMSMVSTARVVLVDSESDLPRISVAMRDHEVRQTKDESRRGMFVPHASEQRGAFPFGFGLLSRK